ncbi:MAG: 4-hydroxythreonine-4-phosphate dehydrogenase PdxA [Burkholderiales bacterium]|nr:4-hydroxythreonine-4-phosphate dehydrogenase PdxA [Burkholderiales bacterium]
MPAIAITVGEPAGVGPELCLRLAERAWAAPLVLIGDKTALDVRAAALGLAVLPEFLAGGESPAHPVSIWNHPLPEFVIPGTLNPQNSREILYTLDTAIHGCVSGYFAAMVTAPVHKGAINDAGIAFTGHTEYLAEATNTQHVVMMLVGGGLRVALATTHLPLKDVPAAITAEALERTLRILEHDLRSKFGIAVPKIAVCGLNPHAGESGYLGHEEQDIIEPLIDSLLAGGMQVYGPYPADTIFVPRHADEYDAILAMYHDQGLPVLKHASFGTGVNVTLGLPLIRTSVDHGTALDLAGTGRADPGSLFAAVELAIDLAGRAG